MSASVGGVHWTKRADCGRGDVAPLSSRGRGMGGWAGQARRHAPAVTSTPLASLGHLEVPSQHVACGPHPPGPLRARRLG